MNMPLLEEAFQSVARRMPIEDVACSILLGSGWSDIATAFEPLAEVAYADIPLLGAPGVAGHKGRLLLARTGSRRVLVFQGRRHWYEGEGWDPVALPVFIAARAGAPLVLLTNAAGGIHPAFRIGDLMVITDHINAMGVNPLLGAHHRIWGERFPDLSRIYDTGLTQQFRQSARDLGLALREGVYLAASGPCYETPAEIRMFRTLGADAVGMSTAPEAILAAAAGLRVGGISCITNQAAGCSEAPLGHDDVLHTTRHAMPAMKALLHHVATHARLEP